MSSERVQWTIDADVVSGLKARAESLRIPLRVLLEFYLSKALCSNEPIVLAVKSAPTPSASTRDVRDTSYEVGRPGLTESGQPWMPNPNSKIMANARAGQSATTDEDDGLDDFGRPRES